MTYSNYLYGALVIGIGLYAFGSFTYDQGKHQVQQQWDLYKIEQLNELTTLQQEYIVRETKYITELNNIKKEYNHAKVNFNNQLTMLKSDYNNKLLESDKRYLSYKKQTSTTKGCTNLADISGKLDRSLTEGISLVRELTETLKLRDSQLKYLGEAYSASMDLVE